MTKTQVKIFKCSVGCNISFFEAEINTFLNNLQESGKTVTDIKFSSEKDYYYCFVVYLE